MSSAADRLRDKGRRTREAAQARTGAEATTPVPTPPAAADDPAPAPVVAQAPTRRAARASGSRAPAAPAVRTAPVRITVDLSPVDHRNLKRWCDETAHQLGRASVAGADVVRVLLDRLHADPALARDVVDGLAQRIR
jgi:hypothetical protein